MSAVEVGALRASATLETASFEVGAQKARRALKSLGTGFEETTREAVRQAEGMARAYDTGFKKTASAVQRQLDALTGIDRATNSASATAKRWASQLSMQARSYDALRSSLDPVFASSKRYEQVVNQVEMAVKSGISSQAEANKILDLAAQKYLGLVPAAEQAARAQEAASSAAASARAAYEQTRASLDPLFASSKRYEAVQEQLAVAVRAGAVTQAEANRVLAMAEKQYLGASSAAAGAAAPMRGFFSIFSKERSHELRQIGLQLSQVGQQGSVTGDYLGAASVQAADIGAMFGIAGVAAGTLISVLGPLALGLLEVGDASKELKQQSDLNAQAMSDLVGALDEYSTYAEGARRSTADLIEEFGAFAEDVKETYEYLSGVSVKRALDALQTENFDLFANLGEAASAISAMEDALSALERNKALGATSEQVQTFRENLEGLQDDAYAAAQAVGLMPDEVRAIKAGFDELRGAQAMEDIQREAKEALDIIRGFYPEGQKLPEALTDAVVQLESIITSSSRAVSETDEATAQTIRWANAMAGVGSEIEAIKSSLATIGGGLLESASKRVEIEALRAGKSIQDARREAEAFNKETEWDARSQGASVFELMAIEAERWVFRSGQATDTLLDKEREAARERERNLKKVATASGKATKELAKELATLKASLDPIEAYNQELAELAKFQGLISEDEMAKAMRNLNVELVDSLPLVGDLTDALVDGLFNGFEDGLDGILRSFKGWLQQMIGLALKNQIVIGMGLTGGASVGGATQAAGGGLGLLSGAGNLLGLGAGGGGFISGVGSGLGGVLSGGGLGSSFANLGGLLTGNVGLTGGAIGAALPAAGLVGAGIYALISGLSRKFAYSALEGTVGAGTFDGFTRDFYKGGWLRSDKSVYGTLDPAVERGIADQVEAMTSGLLDFGDALGLGRSALADYEGYFLSVMTSGRSQEQIAEDIARELGAAAEEMSQLILGTDAFSHSGEAAVDALTRLGSSLLTVNDTLDLLNGTLFEASLVGGDMASELADLFGGLESFTSSAGVYWQAFYSEAERAEILTRRLGAAFGDLGLSMPTTREGFRDLVDGLDLTTAGGRELYAELLQMAGALDQVLPQISSFSAEILGMIDGINLDLTAHLSAAAEAQRGAEEAARLWFRASDSLRDFISSLTGDVLGRGQNLAVSRARFGTAYGMALAGDADAAADIPGLAQAYLDNARNASGTELDYRKIAAQVQGQVRTVEAIAELKGTQEDRLSALYGQQIDVLTSLQSYLQTDGVTAEGIAEFRSAIGNLDGAIQETSAFEVNSIVGLGGSIDGARDAIGISAGLFDTAGRRLISEFGSLGDQIGISLSDFVLGVPDEIDLQSSALQSALGSLEDTIIADRVARERAAEIARLQQLGMTAMSQIDGSRSSGSSIVASIEALESQTGVQLLRNGDKDALLSVGDQGYINYKADYYSGTSAGIAAFRAQFYGPDGLQAQIAAHNQRAVAAIQQAEAYRAQLRALGEAPAFAQGGTHRGGLAHIGENDLELVAPSRIYNPSETKAMLDNREMVLELQRLREELRDMRLEQRQLGMSIANTNEKLLKIERRRDALTDAEGAAT